MKARDVKVGDIVSYHGLQLRRVEPFTASDADGLVHFRSVRYGDAWRLEAGDEVSAVDEAPSSEPQP